jgi:DNA polymerase III subunit epsilon
MNNILWFDLETTGTDPKKHGIIQIAACVERDGLIIDTFNEKQKPDPLKVLDPKALQVNGHTPDEISKFQDSKSCYLAFNRFLDKHGARGNKALRYIPAGYNAQFDLDFMCRYFEEQSGGPYAFWEHLQYQPIDPYPTIVTLWRLGKLHPKDCKLETICAHFGIELKAHDAMSDILATRELVLRLMGAFLI